MTQAVSFPQSLFPDVQRLTPDVGAQNIQTSPHGAQSVTTFAGSERWRLELTFSELVGDARADLQGFVVALRVSRNHFLIVNHTAPQRGVLNGTPMFNSLSGHVVTVGNLGAAVSSYVRFGDFISVNSELKMVTSDAGTDGSGNASFPVWPPFRERPSSGDLVVVSSPCGAFRMERSSVLHTTPPGYQTTATISAVERVNSANVSELL